ncbi:MAG: glycosyltransferase family 4 protein [Akkermansiaceae bacterium]
MRKVIIHSPYSESASQGNSVTATRMEGIFTEHGFKVAHSQQEYSGEAADVMIALNARKSAKAIARFRYLHPASQIIIVLTGTDINHPDVIDKKSTTRISMRLADRLVVLHEASLKQVPEIFREKTSVVYPSVTIPSDVKHSADDDFTIIYAGNIRQEKNPALLLAVAKKLPSAIQLELYGDAGDLRSSKLNFHGVVPHKEMLRAMSKAHVLLNTSFQEGGANAICEAISMGLPVLATAIPGNIGMLGEDYAGLFPSDDLEALVNLIEKAANDSDFYALLKKQVAARAPLFAHERESASWLDLLNDLSN